MHGAEQQHLREIAGSLVVGSLNPFLTLWLSILDVLERIECVGKKYIDNKRGQKQELIQYSTRFCEPIDRAIRVKGITARQPPQLSEWANEQSMDWSSDFGHSVRSYVRQSVRIRCPSDCDLIESSHDPDKRTGKQTYLS